MYLVCSVTLAILFLIVILLWKEERRLRNNVTHGLASKFWMLMERRRFVRFADEIKIRYNPLRNPHNSSYAKTSNISKKGLCLLTYEKLKEKDFVDVELEIPDFPRPVRVVGQIMWTKDLNRQDTEGRRLFYAGLRFYKISPNNEAILLKHLSTLKREGP